MIALEKIHPNDWNPNEMTAEEFTELVAEVRHLGQDSARRVISRLLIAAKMALAPEWSQCPHSPFFTLPRL